MSGGQILRLLKEQTATQHARVERAFDLPRRLQSSDSYAELLTIFYRLYLPLEQRLNALADDLPDVSWPTRRKAPKLLADLKTIGRKPEEIVPASDLPSVSRPADVYGCLYVMEGATLGGQIIRRAVAAQLGYSADHGCAFFSGYGDRGGEMWEQFRTALTRFADTAEREQAVLAAATATFETFRRHLAEAPPQ